MSKKFFRALLVFAFALSLILVMTAFTSCVKPNKTKYEIAFESNGGTMYYNIRALEDDTIILPTPEKEGYEFLGWYGSNSFDGKALKDAYVVKENATLYAKWRAFEGTIKFESNGGTRYSDLTFSAQRIELPIPKKEGYIFGGWYDNANFSGKSLSGSILPTDDTTLYAKWDIITGTVIFESNGGTKYNNVDTAGQKVQLPTPQREGYYFAGWYDNAEFNGKVYKGEIVPDKTITLYARWATAYKLISLEENGGIALDDIKLFEDDTLSLPEASRWGYIFNGWYDNAELSGEPLNEYFYYPSGDVTLYAKWEKCSYLYLFYGETKMDWVRFEYPVGTTISYDELYRLMSPNDIVVTDFLGDRHVLPFMYWAYQGVDEKSHIKVTSDVTIDDEFLILVAQYDDSEVPPREYLEYDKEKDIYTVTGKIAHLFYNEPAQMPYAYTIDMSFRKGIGGGVGPAFRMRVSDADYHYEGGCDYLSPVISPDNGSLYIASVLGGKWSNFVTSIDITSLPQNWQDKFINTENKGLIEMSMSIVDYGTWFEVYIDNELAYTYTNSSKLANYPYTGLGVRSSSVPAKISNPRVSYGYNVSYSSGVSGLTAPSTTWMCGRVELPDWRRDGYALEGWYYDAEFTKPVDDVKFDISSNVTLYAKWSTDYDVVSFNTNGGNACDDLNYAGGKLFLPTTTKMNYIFTGWYYDAALTQEVDPYEFSTTGNTTLYAGWRLPHSHLTSNGDGSYNYNKKTEAVLGTMDSGIPQAGTYHEFSQTVTMTKGVASVGIAFRMNMNLDYTYETTGTDYISAQFAGNTFRISYVKNGAWARLLPNNKDYSYDKMPQGWKDKYTNTADGEQITVTLTIRDYGSYFEAYIDGELAYTYGQNGETVDLTQFIGNGYGVRCSAGSAVVFKNITAKVVNY